MDIVSRIIAYDCSDGGHCDAAQGLAYDLMTEAKEEIQFLRGVLRCIAHQETDPVVAARDALLRSHTE